MRRSAPLFMIMAGFLLLSGCKKDTVTSPDAQGLVGTLMWSRAAFRSAAGLELLRRVNPVTKTIAA